MRVPEIQDLQEGKLIKEIDFQILLCKENIKNYQKSIEKTKRMSGMDGPSGIRAGNCSGLPRAGIVHMDFPDAFASIAKDEKQIKRERETIRALRLRRRKLILTARSLEGTEQSIFVCRVIHKMTQDATADAIGISTRHLQRIEQRMKRETRVFGL